MEYDIEINAIGTKLYYKKGTKILHREDGPAMEYPNGSKRWCINGYLHRENGPAIEYSDGYKEWYINGKHHRIDGPAVEWGNGAKEWWVDGNILPLEKQQILNKWWDNKNAKY